MKGSGSSKSDGTGSRSAEALDAAALELATGLSITDMEALGAETSPDARSNIAIKLARHVHRQPKGPVDKLAIDLMGILSRDRDRHVRERFADAVKTNPRLPPSIAVRLARDDIDVAAPILRESQALDEAIIADIIKTKPEAHACVIADRRPLSETLVDLLIEYRGTLRVVARLLDNDQAALSEPVLLHLQEWGQVDPEIADRLRRRPNLPLAFINQGVADLADQVRWPSLGERTMSKFEATQLQGRFDGKVGHRCSLKGERFNRFYQALRREFESGQLKPSTLLAFLRDRDVDRLECGFAVMTGLELRWVRNLLHGSDRRGLIALCLKADFSTADYLAFRIAFGLAELGAIRDQAKQRYPDKNMEFAREQFEKMRAEPDQLLHWLPSSVR
ncbi:MAG: DUF2336 domain-containing protein [Geminicoccaceae bacterium]